MQDPVRQSMLARMGIQSWQLRRPALLGADLAPELELEQNATQPGQTAPATSTPQPSGKLWLLAPQLPATTLLADICQLLGMTPDEVSLLSELPPADLQAADASPLLWLTEANPARPDALICPLAPSAAQKRALWQQLRQHLAANAA
ncbi:MAG: DNA polymerase III subunit psi [Aeromonas veronii]